MRTLDWALRLSEHSQIGPLLQPLDQSVEWRTVAPEARPILAAAGYLAHPRKTLIVTASYERALAWQAKLQLCGLNQDSIFQLPSGLSSLFEDAAPEHIALSDRLGALRALAEPGPIVAIASVGAALERTLPKEVLLASFIEIKVGAEMAPDEFLKSLIGLGYEQADPVRLPGQFSQRGGILDVFATGRDHPIRIEMFGDEIESIRIFDPNTQRSVGQVRSVSLVPSRESLYTQVDSGMAELIRNSASRESSLLEDESGERLMELVYADAISLEQRAYFDRIDLYRPILHPESGCAIDLLEEGDLLILDEALELESIAARGEEELSTALKARAQRGEILHSTALDFLLPAEHLASHPVTLAMTSMNSVPSWLQIPRKEDVDAISLEAYRGRSEALALTLRNYRSENFELIFTTDQPNRAKTVLGQVDLFPIDEPGSGQGLMLHGNLGGGFVMPNAKLCVVSDAELFGVARLRLPQKRFLEGAPIATVLDLKPGDYVVHIAFGIGIFRGLVKRNVQGIDREFLYIEYQAPDKLFVPADQLDRVQKYLNPGDAQPKLNRLTGGEWQRTLGKAREEARLFARDLVKLYAERKRAARRPYGPDTPFQTEMESTFPWVETPSQQQAIVDSKADMRLDWPMDRLVCGDVGFGKTEVAIRAAFKAVQDGRQVAVLCPTTILSEQHFRNFVERLAPFGTKLALINRFTHTQNRKATIAGLKSGEIEIVIGTHALLGVGIEFNNLGLAVIDEEQKFGVKQKEMLKTLRSQVDVLTLSATPIPRTLSMALMDIRQMSLINDPPPGRLPVRTFVRPYAAEVVCEAILRELARGGQAFYVYNRIEGIMHVAEKLRKLVPMARIGMGHGQMTEKELEPIMIGFIKGEIDVLLSTTIIESGIDIPNANTLIVENSDRLGLAQLYQLRGRVGRSDRQAYAYLLYGNSKDLGQNALQRLTALQEFSTLGSGYSLAFRDLQIRGAGELLGAKQSGTMTSVGFELYTQLINEAVTQLKNSVEGAADPLDTVPDPLAMIEPLPAFDLPVKAFIPEGYIQDQAQRLYYYQQMMSARDFSALSVVEADVEDRYGHPPAEVRRAFTIMNLRMRARNIGVEKLDARQGRLHITFKHPEDVPPRVFSILSSRKRDAYLTKEAYIWPIASDPILGVESFLRSFEEAFESYTVAKAALPE
jgi:transcription-repair coupling factor (superfamily II helicase)